VSTPPTILPRHARYLAKIVAISPNEFWRSENVRRAEELARRDAEYVRLAAAQDDAAATERLVQVCRENLLLRVSDFIEDFERDGEGVT
jgi:hypothetical protein